MVEVKHWDSKNGNWIDMWSIASWKKVLVENERNDLPVLCVLCDAVRERDMVHEEGDGDFEKNKQRREQCVERN